MIVVLSANNNGSDINTFLGASKLYMLWTTEGLELLLGELHLSMYPSQENILVVIDGFTFLF